MVNSSLKTDATIEELKLAWKQSRARKKKEKKKEQGGAVKHKAKGSHFSADNSSVKNDATTKEENLSRKWKRARKKKKQGKAVEHKDKIPHFSVDNPSLKTDATIEEVNSSQKRERVRKKKKQGKAFEHEGQGPNFSPDNSSLKTDATTEEVNSSRKWKMEKAKKKQGKAVGHKDKGPHVSLDKSSLKTDATMEEVNSSRKRKRERKKKKQGKAVEHKDAGPHVSLDKSSLKTDATTEEVNSSRKGKRERKKKKQGKAVEHKDEGPHVSLDKSSLKTESTIEEVNSSQKRKRERKKKKQGKAVEHKDEGPHVSLDKSLLKTGATTEEVNSSRKRKRERKKKKQGKGVEHKVEGPHVSLDKSSLKTESTIEDPLHMSPALPNLLSSQRIVAFRSRKKNKKREWQKTKHNAIENNVNSYGAPNNTFSSKTSTPALHMPSEHPIQFVSTDPVTSQSCVETSICRGEIEEKEQHIPKKATENCNGVYDVQEVSCFCNSVVANAECCAKESVLEVVRLNKEQGIINYGSNHMDNSDFVENASLAKDNDDYSAVHHVSEKFQSAKTYPRTGRVNPNYGRNGYPSPMVQLEGASDRQLNYTESTRNDVCCAVGDVFDLSLVSINGGHSKIPHLPLGRTITSKSKNKLLILDVNGLLADFVSSVPRGSRPPDFLLKRKKVYKRPFCGDFLQFCLDKFHVGVWSSRTKHNLDKAIKFLFGKSASKLLFCWNQSQCTKTKSYTLEDKHKPLVFKELRKLWEKAVPNLPWEKGEFNESNTLLLDDSPYKALLNPRYTAIFPYSYHFDDIGDTSLGRGGDLRVYLEGLARAENVQEYVSSNPFGQEAIIETNPSWDFYREVIEAVKRRQNAARMQATSSGQRQSSTTTDQGTANLSPAARDPPQQTKAAPPSATEDPPQQTKAAPPSATEDPPQQTKALPPPATEDPPQKTKAPPPPATGGPPRQTDPLPSPATATAAILP